MQQVIDTIYDFMLKIQAVGSKTLDYGFVTNIFSEFCDEIPQLKNLTFTMTKKEQTLLDYATRRIKYSLLIRL